nr:MAG TPA: hypothetical protein [Caudoviricetes sp.]
MLTNKICTRHIFTFKDPFSTLLTFKDPYLFLIVALGRPLAVPFLYS